MKSIVEHIYKKKGYWFNLRCCSDTGSGVHPSIFSIWMLPCSHGFVSVLGETDVHQAIHQHVNQHQRSWHKTLEFLDQRSKPHVVRSNLLIRGFWESSRWFMIMVLHLLEIKHMVSGHVLLEMKQLVTDRSSTSFGNQKSG